MQDNNQTPATSQAPKPKEHYLTPTCWAIYNVYKQAWEQNKFSYGLTDAEVANITNITIKTVGPTRLHFYRDYGILEKTPNTDKHYQIKQELIPYIHQKTTWPNNTPRTHRKRRKFTYGKITKEILQILANGPANDNTLIEQITNKVNTTPQAIRASRYRLIENRYIYSTNDGNTPLYQLTARGAKLAKTTTHKLRKDRHTKQQQQEELYDKILGYFKTKVPHKQETTTTTTQPPPLLIKITTQEGTTITTHQLQHKQTITWDPTNGITIT